MEARKRENESMDLGGESEAKKAKTTETDAEPSQSLSQRERHLLYLEMQRKRQERAEFVEKCVSLKEYEIFLISKGASDEIINKVMKMRPEDAYSPHEDVQKALEGFDKKGWFFGTYTDDDLEHGYRPGLFTNHNLYSRLCLSDFDLPENTTYEGDRQCLSFLKEFEKLLEDFKSKDPYWEVHLDECECWKLTTELAKNYPQVVKQHMLYAFKDVAVTQNWRMFSSELKNLFLSVWDLVFEGGLDYSRALQSAWDRLRFYGYFHGREFQKSSVAALLKDIFEVVANKINPSSSDEVIEQSFDEALLENSNKLMEYYPQFIRKRMKIAKQIGIV